MKRTRSDVASRVVAVFSKGWQLTSAKSMSALSTTTSTSAAERLISANGVTECRNAKHGLEEIALAEAEPAGAEPLGQRLEIDSRLVLGDDQHHAPVLVGEEQVLGVGAREGGAQGASLLDREHRLMLDRGRGDAELFQPREQRPAIGGVGFGG